MTASYQGIKPLATSLLTPVGLGLVGLEKGTDCAAEQWRERWLSRRKMAKKGLLSSYYNDKGAVRVFASNILHHITIVYIQICS